MTPSQPESEPERARPKFFNKPWPTTPDFPPTYLTKSGEPEAYQFPPAPKQSEPSSSKPTKQTRPLAGSPHPAKYYSQIQCPICGTHIADGHDRHFIGHGPCLHRGPCPDPKCIKAYYGVSRQWANPYRGKKPLYCQAPGCGRRIEQWYFVRARLTGDGRTVWCSGQVDPALYKAWREEQDRWCAERRREREREREEEEKERKRREKETELGLQLGKKFVQDLLSFLPSPLPLGPHCSIPPKSPDFLLLLLLITGIFRVSLPTHILDIALRLYT
ncbi:hypothetical protein VTK56DRAFT_903 [Thermocarpiscus australiensis]